MESRLNLLLEQVPVDEKYSVSSYTDVNMAAGCIKALTFKPWDDFGKVLKDGLAAVDRLPSEALSKASKCLATCAEVISETKEKHARVVATENRLNAQMTFHRGRKRVRRQHVQKPITNSGSLSRVHENVFRLVEILIAAINKMEYPGEVLDITSRTCVSENLKMYVSKELKSREPLDWLKLALPHTDKPDFGLFCASASDLGRIPLCTYECKGPTLDISSVRTVDRKALLEAKSKKEEEQIPMEKMISNDKPEGTTLRPCDSDQAMESATADIVEADSNSLLSGDAASATAILNTDEGICATKGDRHTHRVDILEEEIAILVPTPVEEESIRIPDPAIIPAKEVTRQFNFLFSDKEHLNKQSEEKYAPLRVALYPVAQVVCQALVSQTGLGFLYNHQTGIAIKVSDLSKDNKLVVHVSGVIGCDTEPGNIAAMVALGKLALDIVHGARSEERIRKLRKMMRVLSESTEDAVGMKPPKKSGSSAAARSDNNANAPSAGAAPTSSRARSTGNRGYNGSQRCFPQDGSGSGSPSVRPLPFEGKRFSNIKSPGSPTAIVEKPVSDELDDEWGKHAVYKVERALKTMFLNNSGVLSAGSSGVLLLSSWKGTDVILKLWNRESKESREDLQNEVVIYTFLRENHPDILGSAVPKMVVAWDNPSQPSLYSKEIILVTDYVGKELVRDTAGVLWINDGDEYEMVDTAEEQLLAAVAMRTLKELHSVGVIHGDVSMRNLRAERVPNGDCSTSGGLTGWRAWWIDLGKAKRVRRDVDQLLFEIDRHECISMFKGIHS